VAAARSGLRFVLSGHYAIRIRVRVVTAYVHSAASYSHVGGLTCIAPNCGLHAAKPPLATDSSGSIGGIGRVRLMFRSFERSANKAWKKLFTN
jgi:hypothetical protein